MAQTVNRTAQSIARPAPRAGILRTLARMVAVRRQRRALARLDDHLLEDIGVTREAAMEEAERAPWDAPGHWRP